MAFGVWLTVKGGEDNLLHHQAGIGQADSNPVRDTRGLEIENPFPLSQRTLGKRSAVSKPRLSPLSCAVPTKWRDEARPTTPPGYGCEEVFCARHPPKQKNRLLSRRPAAAATGGQRHPCGMKSEDQTATSSTRDRMLRGSTSTGGDCDHSTRRVHPACFYGIAVDAGWRPRSHRPALASAAHRPRRSAIVASDACPAVIPLGPRFVQHHRTRHCSAVPLTPCSWHSRAQVRPQTT